MSSNLPGENYTVIGRAFWIDFGSSVRRHVILEKNALGIFKFKARCGDRSLVFDLLAKRFEPCAGSLS